MKSIKRLAGKVSKRLARLIIVVSVLAIIGYGAAVLLLTQTVPAGTSAALISTSCTSGATPLTANTTFYIQGITSYIRLTCTVDSKGYNTKGSIVATPTFTLPSPFTQLWSFNSSTATGTTCAGGTGAWQMTSGSPHTFPSAWSGWDLCGVIPSSGTGDWASFTVSWS